MILFVATIANGWCLYIGIRDVSAGGIVFWSTMGIIVFILWLGFFMVHPNEARVLQMFGAYRGTERTPGLRWANPFYTKAKVSVRVRNFETEKLKVSEAALRTTGRWPSTASMRRTS